MNRYTSIIVQTESNVKLACILPLRNRKSRLYALISRREALLPSSCNMQVLGCKPIRKHTISVNIRNANGRGVPFNAFTHCGFENTIGVIKGTSHHLSPINAYSFYIGISILRLYKYFYDEYGESYGRAFFR